MSPLEKQKVKTITYHVINAHQDMGIWRKIEVHLRDSGSPGTKHAKSDF